MSLKFGVYLVEQKILTPEQFCGLVKIQQSVQPSLEHLAIRKNILAVSQMARILDLQQQYPHKSFSQIAVENDLMEEADAHELYRVQERMQRSMEELVVDCGLLTARQVATLRRQFEKESAAAGKSPLSAADRATGNPVPAPKMGLGSAGLTSRAAEGPLASYMDSGLVSG